MHLSALKLYNALSIILTGLVLIAMGIFTFLLSTRITELSNENQTYTRYNSCVLSFPALDRDKENIEACWTKVQKETGFQVKRYDK